MLGLHQWAEVGQTLKSDGGANTMPTGPQDEVSLSFSPFLMFSPGGGFKVDHSLAIKVLILLSINPTFAQKTG